jgi:predicted DNA binding CopG/RHH family protein
MAKRVLKPIPKFRNEAEERRFWETHDTTDYVDWSKAQDASFPDLKPTTTTISLRIPSGLLSELKILANKHDVPYQSLLKVLLAESVARERRLGASAQRLHASRARRRRRA